MKTIPISYIGLDEEIDSIRELKLEMVGRYMEKYESGTSKPILVKRIGRDKYILIDGKHRLEACKKLKRNKIDIEEFSGEDIYSKAVECNQEHGIPLTKEEEEIVLLNFINIGKSDEEIGKIFHLSRRTINNRINSNKSLKLARVAKSKVPTINYFLSGKKQCDIAKDLKITDGAVSQRINNWIDNEIIDVYELGYTKEDILNKQNKNKIKLTIEKLNELIEEDYNKLIIGDCLKEIPKLDNEVIDCLIIDPPYGMSYQSNHRKEKFDKIKNDDEEAFKILDKSLLLVEPKLKKNSHIYIFTSWKVLEKVKPIVEKHFKIKNCLVWDKVNHGCGDLDGDYGEQYELILFAVKGKRKLQIDKRPNNILSYKKVNESSMVHQTEKPIELLRELIRNSTKEKELVLDYFAGSCSTLKAAKEEGRRWLGIEIEK